MHSSGQPSRCPLTPSRQIFACASKDRNWPGCPDIDHSSSFFEVNSSIAGTRGFVAAARCPVRATLARNETVPLRLTIGRISMTCPHRYRAAFWEYR